MINLTDGTGTRQDPPSPSKIDAILALHRKGFSVFPVEANGKRPAVMAWQNWPDTEDAIRSHWSRHPDDNVGIRTAGLLVLDIDRRHGGVESFKALCASSESDLPNTILVETQGGGFHIYYRPPAGARVANSAGKLGTGLDVRGAGGYVVAPPSTIDGRKYAWGKDRSPQNIAIAEAPTWLLERCQARCTASANRGERIMPETDAAIAKAQKWLGEQQDIAEGERSDTLFRMAAKLGDFGIEQATALEELTAWCDEKCHPPLDFDELTGVVSRAFGASRQNAIGSKHPENGSGFEAVASKSSPADEIGDPLDFWEPEAPYPSLPEGVLPQIVDEFARDRARRLGIEPGPVAAATLATLGSLVPAGNCLQMRQHDPHWTVRPILWVTLIGDPGSGKSPALSEAMRLAEAVESKWRAEFAAAKRKSMPLAIDSDARKDVALVPETDSPKLRRKIVNDATPEKLIELLAENQSGLLCCVDELAGLFASMDAYRAKGGKDRAFWLQAKEGRPFTSDRKGSGTTHAPVCAVSVLGGIQPDRLSKIANDLSEDGLLQRFTPVFVKKIGRGEDIPPNTIVDNEIAAAASWIAEAPLSGRYKLSAAAIKERETLEEFFADALQDPEIPTAARQWIDKVPNEFGRFALVFHFIEHGNGVRRLTDEAPPEFISGDTAARVRRFLTEFAYPTARAFYEQLWVRPAEQTPAKWIAGYILARGIDKISVRDIYRAYPKLRPHERREAIPATMRALELSGWAKVWRKDAHGIPTMWSINPAVHDGRFAEVARREKERRENVRKKIAVGCAAAGATVSPSVT